MFADVRITHILYKHQNYIDAISIIFYMDSVKSMFD